jgi:hypothetical protein
MDPFLAVIRHATSLSIKHRHVVAQSAERSGRRFNPVPRLRHPDPSTGRGPGLVESEASRRSGCGDYGASANASTADLSYWLHRHQPLVAVAPAQISAANAAILQVPSTLATLAWKPPGAGTAP